MHDVRTAVIKDRRLRRRKGREYNNGVSGRGLKTATFRKHEGIQQDRRTNTRTGGSEAGSRFLRQDLENDCQDIVGKSALTRTEEETTSGLRSEPGGSPTTSGSSLPVNGRNGNTDYS